MQAGFYLTPVLYLITLLPAQFAKISILNPMAQIIQDLRWSLVTRETMTIGQLWEHWYIWLIPISFVLLTLVSGIWYFRSRQARFAEEV
jgi:ABC-2 type transport system permease protein